MSGDLRNSTSNDTGSNCCTGSSSANRGTTIGSIRGGSRKLCVVLSSVYPTDYHSTFDDSSECIEWNKEVDDDFNVVKRVLSPDHVIIDIRIPVKLGKLDAQKLLIHELKTLLPVLFPFRRIDPSSDEQSTDCHIVLNTHGTPGYFDLSHDVVLELFTFLLYKSNAYLGNVKITQVSALMCDGFAGQTREQKRALLRMHLTFEGITLSSRLRASVMSVLRQKLEILRCRPGNAQSFEIRGMDRAYDPATESDLVMGIVLGTAGKSLFVSIPECDPSDLNDKHRVLQCIQTVRAYKRGEEQGSEVEAMLTKADYEKAGNVLSKVLNVMKEEIISALSGAYSVEQTNCSLLLASLQEHARFLAIHEELNSSNFEGVYRDWLKTYKVYSKERLDILENYINSDDSNVFNFFNNK